MYRAKIEFTAPLSNWRDFLHKFKNACHLDKPYQLSNSSMQNNELIYIEIRKSIKNTTNWGFRWFFKGAQILEPSLKILLKILCSLNVVPFDKHQTQFLTTTCSAFDIRYIHLHRCWEVTNQKMNIFSLFFGWKQLELYISVQRWLTCQIYEFQSFIY